MSSYTTLPKLPDDEVLSLANNKRLFSVKVFGTHLWLGKESDGFLDDTIEKLNQDEESQEYVDQIEEEQ